MPYDIAVKAPLTEWVVADFKTYPEKHCLCEFSAMRMAGFHCTRLKEVLLNKEFHISRMKDS